MDQALPPEPLPDSPERPDAPVGVLLLGALDPSGAGGLGADVLTVAAIGAHPLGAASGAWVRDTCSIHAFHALPVESLDEQARAVLEDMTVGAIKAGFLGDASGIATVAELVSDYPELPLVVHMPGLSWCSRDAIDHYLDAAQDLLLPMTDVLVGNHGTLARWLLPDWSGEQPPGARDIAAAAGAHGVAVTLVTGRPGAGEQVENTLASPNAVLLQQRFERIEADFAGAGDTLSAALAALLALGADLSTAAQEALQFLDGALAAGFRPGMGMAVPDRLFWAHADDDADDAGDNGPAAAGEPAASHDRRADQRKPSRPEPDDLPH